MFDTLLFIFFLLLLIFFHETGHRIVAGRNFIKFRTVFFFGVGTDFFANKLTLAEFMQISLAGFIYGMPLIVLGMFVLTPFYSAALFLVALLACVMDFLAFFSLLALHLVKRIPLNRKMEDIKSDLEWME